VRLYPTEPSICRQPFTTRDAGNGCRATREEKTDLDINGVFRDDIEYVVHG